MEKGASKSKWWWIGSHNTSDLSPWLQSTISELDAKTKMMLRVIEEEADSFAERAEMYYRKRPELIAMVEDLYRTYRSLAEKYDVARSSSLLHKHAPPEKSIHVPEALDESTYNEKSWMIQVPESPEKPVHVPVSPEKSILVPKALERSNSNEESWMLHVPDTAGKSTNVPETPRKSTYTEESWAIHVPKTPERSTSKHESWSYASEIEEYEESEVDDGESSVDDAVNGDEGEGDVESMIDDAEAMMRMKEELERLREENRASSELLRQKDEEKREAIRQLSLALEMIKEENLELKKCVSAAAKQKQMSPKKQLWSPFQFKKLKEGFLGNFALGF